jgi:hypothetical protein
VQIYLGGGWKPLSSRADPAQLAELQSGAVSAANASLTADGRLKPQ